jgi:hypothetical protein
MSIYVPAESKGTLWEEVGAGRNIHLGQFREVAELCWEGTPKQTIVTVPATFNRKLKNTNYPLQFYTDNWAADYSWFSWNYDLIASFAHITQYFRHQLWSRIAIHCQTWRMCRIATSDRCSVQGKLLSFFSKWCAQQYKAKSNKRK